MMTGQDMVKNRVSYDESRDIGRMDRDETSLIALGGGFSFDDIQDARSDEISATLGSDVAKDWIEGLLLMIAGILGFLTGGLIVVFIAWAAQSAGLDARAIAPTAAEVLAPGFDLEAKIAEVEP